MNVLVTGGTGFIGKPLCKRLVGAGHTVFVLSRHPDEGECAVKEIRQLSDLDGSGEPVPINVVINLAGEPIANKRWSDAQKRLIIESRVETTQGLIDYFSARKARPSVFISGSAVGYYGIATSNLEIDECAVGDDSFSSQLCQAWESTALAAESLGIRTCLLRTGIVLGFAGGALMKMLPPFKLGLGGKMGDGTQWMPWVHLDDLVSIILYCIDCESLHGAVNGTAPNPVTNQTFSQTLGRVLNRPTLLPMPSVVLRFIMGEMGVELLLSGRKVVPAKLLDSGFQFQYTALDKALTEVVSRKNSG